MHEEREGDAMCMVKEQTATSTPHRGLDAEGVLGGTPDAGVGAPGEADGLVGDRGDRWVGRRG